MGEVTTVELHELLQCPFCGSHALSPGFNAALWWISCSGCEAEMSHAIRERVVSMWNTRTLPERPLTSFGFYGTIYENHPSGRPWRSSDFTRRRFPLPLMVERIWIAFMAIGSLFILILLIHTLFRWVP